MTTFALGASSTTYRKPNVTVFLETKCPGSYADICRNVIYKWKCSLCHSILEYGFDGNVYCMCGENSVSSLRYKCNDPKHGLSFMTFNDNDILSIILAELKPPRQHKTVNVLLIGDTGVAKSTWINGIYNYLTCPTLEDAINNETKHLTPIVMAMDSHDSATDIEGQSVNQMRKAFAHAFSTKETYIRLLHSPGVEDCEDMEDDISFGNISPILQDLDEIHGICILLEPNDKKLNAIQELLTHLPKVCCKNIVFIFTSTLNTEDTLSSLNAILNENKDAGIVSDKDTVYYTDNALMQFLAARKQGIEFGETEIENYSQSWKNSVAEAERLIGHLRDLKGHSTKRRSVSYLCEIFKSTGAANRRKETILKADNFKIFRDAFRRGDFKKLFDILNISDSPIGYKNGDVTDFDKFKSYGFTAEFQAKILSFEEYYSCILDAVGMHYFRKLGFLTRLLSFENQVEMWSKLPYKTAFENATATKQHEWVRYFLELLESKQGELIVTEGFQFYIRELFNDDLYLFEKLICNINDGHKNFILFAVNFVNSYKSAVLEKDAERLSYLHRISNNHNLILKMINTELKFDHYLDFCKETVFRQQTYLILASTSAEEQQRFQTLLKYYCLTSKETYYDFHKSDLFWIKLIQDLGDGDALWEKSLPKFKNSGEDHADGQQFERQDSGCYSESENDILPNTRWKMFVAMLEKYPCMVDHGYPWSIFYYTCTLRVCLSKSQPLPGCIGIYHHENSVNYCRETLKYKKVGDMKEFWLWFDFATDEQQREILLTNNYEILKEAFEENYFERILYCDDLKLRGCLNEECKGGILTMVEYKKCVLNAIDVGDFESLLKLTKFLNAENKVQLWCKIYCQDIYERAIENNEFEIARRIHEVFFDPE